MSLGTVQNPISSNIPRCTPRLVCKIGYGFGQWSGVSFVIKKLVYLFMVKQCIYLVIQVYFMQIYFYFLWFGNKFPDFCVFPKFLLTLRKVKNEGKQNSEKISKLNFKAVNLSLTISSKLCTLTLRSHVRKPWKQCFQFMSK